MAGDIELPTAENVSRNFDLIEDASTFIGHLDQGHNPGKMSIMTKVFDARFGWLTGPSRYGGRVLPPSFQRRYASLEGQFETPSQACRGIGPGMIAPTILAHGTDQRGSATCARSIAAT
jgi:hypothetical protein